MCINKNKVYIKRILYLLLVSQDTIEDTKLIQGRCDKGSRDPL